MGGGKKDSRGGERSGLLEIACWAGRVHGDGNPHPHQESLRNSQKAGRVLEAPRPLEEPVWERGSAALQARRGSFSMGLRKSRGPAFSLPAYEPLMGSPSEEPEVVERA